MKRHTISFKDGSILNVTNSMKDVLALFKEQYTPSRDSRGYTPKEIGCIVGCVTPSTGLPRGSSWSGPLLKSLLKAGMVKRIEENKRKTFYSLCNKRYTQLPLKLRREIGERSERDRSVRR